MADSFVSMLFADCGGGFYSLCGSGECGGEAEGANQEDAILRDWGDVYEENQDWDTKEQTCLYPGADGGRLYRNSL